MDSMVCIRYANVLFPWEYLPRVRILQQPFEEIMQSHQSTFGKTVYETFRTILQPPNAIFVSLDKDHQKQYGCLFDKGRIVKKGCVNFHGLQQVINESHFKGQYVPQMYVVIVKACRIQPSGLVLQICNDSSTLLNSLSYACSLENLGSFVYIIDLQDIDIDITSENELYDVRKTFAEKIGLVVNDVDKKLIARVLIQGQDGVIGRFSRLLEKQFVGKASNTITFVRKSVENSRRRIQNWCLGDFGNIILSHYRRNEELINVRFLQLLPDDQHLDRVCQTIASTLAKEVNQALVGHVTSIGSCDFFAFPMHEMSMNKLEYKITERVKRIMKNKRSSSQGPLIFVLSDFIEDEAVRLMVNTLEERFCKEWNGRTARQANEVRAAIDELQRALKQQENMLTEQIPFEIQLALQRFEEIRSIKKTSQALVIKVKNTADIERSQFLKDQVDKLLKEMWPEFNGNLKIVPSGKGITLMKTLESGCTICIKKNSRGDLGRGIGCVFGEVSKRAKFIFTCSHVAPPEERVYTTERQFIGKSKARFTIEPSDDITGAFIDFTAVKVSSYSEVELHQKLYHPFGKTSKVRAFDGNYESLSDKKLYLYKTSILRPVFVVYNGVTCERIDSSSSESETEDPLARTSAQKFTRTSARKSPTQSFTSGSQFRRIDTIRYEDKHGNTKIQQGDSGSAICYYDAEKDEVVLVFLLIGCNDDGDDEEEFLCCRFSECLQCLKLREPSMKLLGT